MTEPNATEPNAANAPPLGLCYAPRPMKKTLAAIVLAAVSLAVLVAQQPSDEAFTRASEAWDAGNYLGALEQMKVLLTGPDGERFVAPVARLTGELFVQQQIAADGRNVRFSPSGRWAAYDAGPRTAAETRVIDPSSGWREVAAIKGTSCVFSPDGSSLAFLRVASTAAIVDARKELDRLSAADEPDRQAVGLQQRKVAQLEAAASQIVVRALPSGEERVLPDGGLLKTALAWSADSREVFFVGMKDADAKTADLHATSVGSTAPRPLTAEPGFKAAPIVAAGGKVLVVPLLGQSPLASGGGAGGGGRGGAPGGGGRTEFLVVDLSTGKASRVEGQSPALSADGSTLAYITRSADGSTLWAAPLSGDWKPTVLKKSPDQVAAPAVSPDGSRIAFEMMYTRNAEIFVINRDGSGETRVTREIQHDRTPRFLGASAIVAIKGEPRHARSYLYDLGTLDAVRLFDNNTLRTITPEYEWAASPDGGSLLVVADRDGDTISPERAVSVVDVTRKVSKQDVLARIDASLSAERRLRAEGERLFQPIAPEVRRAADQVSTTRIYGYEAALFDFDSKHITQPGNAKAAAYIHRTLKSFGYEPEFQTFEARNVKTSNVLATLRGTADPDIVYVLSSHFDSNQRGPGADDNSSATAVLLETARVLAKTPMPATIVFAAFTGEEAGLLGSREFVRQAQQKKTRIAAALNNDMIGWANDHRLDNTIRYSNAGIRDLQHAAAFLFSRLITYDARYFKSTDAAAYYEAYGDIVGGFGSYPVLGNPYYHQPTDLLETVNHQLVAETARATVASIMRLASGPSRVQGLTIARVDGSTAEATWTPSPETGVTRYVVAYGNAAGPQGRRVVVTSPRVSLSGLGLRTGDTLHVAVKAVSRQGLESWDWARATRGLDGRK